MAAESEGNEWAYPGQACTTVTEQVIVYYLFNMAPWLDFKLNEGNNIVSVH